MLKKLTEDQMQRAAWTWLHWLTSPTGSGGEYNAIELGRNLVKEIEEESEDGPPSIGLQEIKNDFQPLCAHFGISDIEESRDVTEKVLQKIYALEKEKNNLKIQLRDLKHAIFTALWEANGHDD